MIGLANTNFSSDDVETGMVVAAIQDAEGQGSACTTIRETLEPLSIQPGAVAVAGPGVDVSESKDDDFTTTSPSVEQTAEESHGAVEAELVDVEGEKRRFQQSLERELAEREMNTPVAEVVSDRWCTRPKVQRYVMLGVLLAIVAIVLGIVLPQALKSESTTPSPSPALIRSDLTDLLSTVSLDGGVELTTPSTPQNDALNWLAGNVNLGNYTNEQKVQRYVLATLYYSSNGDNWKENTGWLTDLNECTNWFKNGDGRFCSSSGAVSELDLNNNKMIGTIPEEIALLSNSLGECFTPSQHHQIILLNALSLMNI